MQHARRGKGNAYETARDIKSSPASYGTERAKRVSSCAFLYK